jgi:hypothetical protein
VGASGKLSGERELIGGQRVNDERSKGSACRNLCSPQKYWKYGFSSQRAAQRLVRKVRIVLRAAFLWMFIRSSEESLKSRNSSFLDPDRVDNLSKAHS